MMWCLKFCWLVVSWCGNWTMWLWFWLKISGVCCCCERWMVWVMMRLVICWIVCWVLCVCVFFVCVKLWWCDLGCCLVVGEGGVGEYDGWGFFVWIFFGCGWWVCDVGWLDVCLSCLGVRFGFVWVLGVLVCGWWWVVFCWFVGFVLWVVGVVWGFVCVNVCFWCCVYVLLWLVGVFCCGG